MGYAYNITEASHWVITAVRDWSLGYGQGSGVGGRWDIRDGGAADCSSLAATTANKGGVQPPLPQSTYTGNIRGLLNDRGWATLPGNTTPREGDFLLLEGQHVAVCVGGGNLAEAWINELGDIVGGAPGDQTGNETRLIPADQHPYRYRWTRVLRPPTGTTPTTSEEDEMTPEQARKLDLLYWSLNNSLLPALSQVAQQVNRLQAQVPALSAAVETLAKGQGLDPQALTQAVTDAVDKRLADVTITLTTKEN